jgi:hypothetical protein
MSVANVERILGAPEKAPVYDSDLHCHYPAIGIFLFFCEDGGESLTGIEVNAQCRCSLAGEEVFPARHEKIRRLVQSASGSSNRAEVIYLGEAGETRMKSESLGMDFYFNADGFLDSINWSELA